MRRTQIQLTEEQSETLIKLARLKGLSIAELIRRSITQYLRMLGTISFEEQKRRAIAVAGRFSSSSGDISTKHDKYLVEAFKK